jgi:hypothetical protein
MTLLVLMALMGAVLGALVRPRLLAIPIAIGLAGGLRGLISLAAPLAIDNDKAPFWAQLSLGAALSAVDGYMPLLAASGGGALIAGLLALITDRPAPKSLTLDEATAVRRCVRNGKYVRTQNMVDEGSAGANTSAEARQRSILGL